MAAATAQSTPDHSAGRRATTLPSKLFGRGQSPGGDAAAQSVETLFVYNAAKVVSFSAGTVMPSAGSRPSSSASSGGGIDQIGTLPWASPTERILAFVPGNVAFLNFAKDKVHPILPKSQCWCVDGETRFVLRIRLNNYYRIELPNTSPDDRMVGEQFKKVLAEVSCYEGTLCPFKRGFTVELPISPETIKRPWRPKTRTMSSPAMTEPSSPTPRERFTARPIMEEDSRETTDDERAQSSDNASIMSSVVDTASEASQEGLSWSGSLPPPADVETPPPSREKAPFVRIVEDEWDLSEKVRGRIQAMESILETEARVKEQEVIRRNQSNTRKNSMNVYPDRTGAADDLKTPTRPKVLNNNRAVTAPPTLNFQAPTLPSSPIDIPTKHSASSQSSTAESIDSFHSFPNLSDDIHNPPTQHHTQSPSTATITPSFFTLPNALTEHSPLESPSTISWHVATSRPSTPPLMDSTSFPSVSDSASPASPTSPLSPTSPKSSLRYRMARRRAGSPLPSPSNLYTPRRLSQGGHLTTLILEKTYSLLLGPPAQLVALMLNIAARITNGVGRRGSFDWEDVRGGRERGRAWGREENKMAGSWELSESEGGEEGEKREESMRRDSWDEDDYGVPLGRVASGLSRPDERKCGGSWEID